MGVPKPYRRTARQFVTRGYGGGANWGYIRHRKYAVAPMQYIRPFLAIQRDMREIFEYIEPSFKNRMAYSYRTHALLMRACVEVEANFPAILRENRYKGAEFTMDDYKRLDDTHRLSSFRVRLPEWRGPNKVRQPYLAWTSGASLPWYDAYNKSKHDRHHKFGQANFDNMIESICGLTVLLSAQFWTYDFIPVSTLGVSLDQTTDPFVRAIGEYFWIEFPSDWPEDQKYDFNWNDLKSNPNPFDYLCF